MGVRLYAPALGRFLSVDPVSGASDNAYDYAWQDPVNESDVHGDNPAALAKAISAIVAVAKRGLPAMRAKAKQLGKAGKKAFTIVGVRIFGPRPGGSQQR